MDAYPLPITLIQAWPLPDGRGVAVLIDRHPPGEHAASDSYETTHLPGVTMDDLMRWLRLTGTPN